MTDAQMVTLIQSLTGNSASAEEAGTYLSLAKSAVIDRLFPYVPTAVWANVPEKYHVRTCEIACYLLNKRGAEGETQHVESGVSRTYESASVPASMMQGIVPFVGVPAKVVTPSEDTPGDEPPAEEEPGEEVEDA